VLQLAAGATLALAASSR